MRVKLTFAVDNTDRRAIASYLDGKKWDGRKATRDEIDGVLRDGAENSLNECIYSFRQKLHSRIAELERSLEVTGSLTGRRTIARLLEQLRDELR